MLGEDKNAQMEMLLAKVMELFSGMPDQELEQEPEAPALEIEIGADKKEQI